MNAETAATAAPQKLPAAITPAMLREARIFTLLAAGVGPTQIGAEFGITGTAVTTYAARRGWLGDAAYRRSVSGIIARRDEREPPAPHTGVRNGVKRKPPNALKNKAARNVDLVVTAAAAGNPAARAAIHVPYMDTRSPAEIAAFVAVALAGASPEPPLPFGEHALADAERKVEALRAALEALSPWRIGAGPSLSHEAYAEAWTGAQLALQLTAPVPAPMPKHA